MTRSPMTATIDGEFVVFLIGMRVNRWWRFDLWVPVARAMSRMLKELEADPALGFLGAENGGMNNPSLMVQYWRSVDHLMDYAKSKDHKHQPAWAAFMKRSRNNSAVGIWHETYRVRAGDHESVYGNFPRPFGLGKAGTLVPATGRRASARGRLDEGSG